MPNTEQENNMEKFDYDTLPTTSRDRAAAAHAQKEENDE